MHLRGFQIDVFFFKPTLQVTHVAVQRAAYSKRARQPIVKVKEEKSLAIEGSINN